MLYPIVFLTSISFLVILHLSLKEKKSLLHYLKKLCSIDSVRFEKNTASILYSLKRVLKMITHYTKKNLHRANTFKRKVLKEIKRKVRKKLFEDKQREQVSDYLSEMKK